MGALNRKAAIGSQDRPERRAAVAPGDRCREVVHIRVRIGVGEGCKRCVNRVAFSTSEAYARDGERRISDRRWASRAEATTTSACERHTDRVTTFIGVGMIAADRKAVVGGVDQSSRCGAVAPADRRCEVAGRCIRIGIGEGRYRRIDRGAFCPGHAYTRCGNASVSNRGYHCLLLYSSAHR